MFQRGFKEGKREGFQNGRRAGIYLAYNYIFPIPVDILDKDLSREAAGLAGMSGRGNKSITELKDYLRQQGYNKVIFKKNREHNRVELIKK